MSGLVALEALKKGSELAFNKIYEFYSKPLYIKILKLTKNTEDTDELLQELFIRVWRNRERIDPEKCFEAYLYTIAQNLVFNYFRKIANDLSLVKRILALDTEHSVNGEQLLEIKQTNELIQEAIDRLSSQQKRVYTLCKVEGKSYNETAKIIGISIATVNSHMTKSAKIIREYLLNKNNLSYIMLVVYLSEKL